MLNRVRIPIQHAEELRDAPLTTGDVVATMHYLIAVGADVHLQDRVVRALRLVLDAQRVQEEHDHDA